MNDLFVFAAHNTVVALVFAFFVYGLTRLRRNPPVAHVLWLLVLLKLVAPPVVCFDWSALAAARIDGRARPGNRGRVANRGSEGGNPPSFRRSANGSNDRAGSGKRA